MMRARSEARAMAGCMKCWVGFAETPLAMGKSRLLVGGFMARAPQPISGSGSRRYKPALLPRPGYVGCALESIVRGVPVYLRMPSLPMTSRYRSESDFFR